MSARRAGRPAWAGLLLAAAPGDRRHGGGNRVKFSLDFNFEGPSAPFLLPLDKGYYKAEGLNVSIDAAQARSSRSSAWRPATTTWALPTSMR